MTNIAEIYDPNSGIWSTTQIPVAGGWSGGSMTVLENGKVLLAGGVTGYWTNNTTVTNKSWLFDPSNNTWSQTGSMNTNRSGHSSALLSDGKVMVLGGGSRQTNIYDPAQGTWTLSKLTKYPTYNGIASLENGDILAIGGDPEGKSAELFTNEPALPTPTANPTPAPTITPTPTPSRNIVLIHGLNTSFRAFLNKQAGFTDLIDSLEANSNYTKKYFEYYQDLGYRLDKGSCASQPNPNENTGPLYPHPDSIDLNICDSQSAMAYNSTKLHDDLSAINLPTTIINYSMGAPITRGWLTLAQNSQNDRTLNIVDTIISFQGVQQGSYGLKLSSFLLQSPGWQTYLTYGVAGGALHEMAYNLIRPAVKDMKPKSDWFRSANLTNVPQNIHYFNFYSDIIASVRPQLLFTKLPAISNTSYGDTVLLPGDSDPTAMPLFGGAKFLPGGAQAQDKHEYSLNSVHEILLGDAILDPLFLNPTAHLFAANDIINDPITHINLNKHLSDESVKIESCKSNIGRVTILSEIERILNNPSEACDL